MVNFLLALFFLLLMPAPFSWASGDSQLQTQYGQDLKHAPFFLRFAFEKKYEKDWKDSSYEERSAFLKDYQNDQKKELLQEKVDAKVAALNEKQRLAQQRKLERLTRMRLAAEAAEDKAEEAEYAKRQADFSKAIIKEQKEIEQMQQSFEEERAEVR